VKDIIYFYLNDGEAELQREELMQRYAQPRYNMIVTVVCETLTKVLLLVEEQSLSGTFLPDASS
jgi:hypothetical protein